ncbi:MAG: sigma-54-dependent Fis family transcriptional regulator [Betaproteobacteria bacterium]|nr:sigma-54-dependent Fis family transcriptional regulator [Betaproteobacteria bacterium]
MAATRKPQLLIVDDDPLIIDTLSFFLGGDFDVSVAASRDECILHLRNCGSDGNRETPQVALVDLGLPPLPHRPDEGFALIASLLAHSPGMKIVVLSGQNEEDHGRHARALGASEFIAKPVDPERLRQTLLKLLAFHDEALPALATPRQSAECALIGASQPIRKLREQARQYANSPFPVLIEGESGSGKEIVVHCCLHRQTERKDRPFFALNCAAISPALVEPILFGHAKGAFTGANASKSGYFEDAGDGTLFLDEIGDLPLDLQPKLLRVLENGEFQRVGETQPRISNARVIAATNRDLRQEVRAGRFRADLYHRLSVFSISAPALREMGEDKRLLLDHFRAIYAQQTGQAPFTLGPDAETCWMAYNFPGNVRELRNIVIRLTTKYPGHTVSATDLEAELDSQSVQPSPGGLPPTDPVELVDTALLHLRQRGDFSLDDTLQLWELAYIEAAQRLTQGNLSQAAKLLGINRTTLYSRIGTLARMKNPGGN